MAYDTPEFDPYLLSLLKSSLRIPDDLTLDDDLLISYLNAAKQYILNASDVDPDKIESSALYPVVVTELATLYYQNRGVLTNKKAPLTLEALITQLRFTI